MTFEQAVYAYLSTYTPLSTIIGTKIFPGMAPQGISPPYIIRQRISKPRYHDFSDADDSSLVRPRHQFDVYSLSYSESLNIMGALKDALLNFSGAMNTLNISWIDWTNEIEMYENDTLLYRQSIDIIVHYHE